MNKLARTSAQGSAKKYLANALDARFIWYGPMEFGSTPPPMSRRWPEQLSHVPAYGIDAELDLV